MSRSREASTSTSRFSRLFTRVALVLGLAIFPAAGQAADLTVQVTNLRSNAGTVHFGLYNTAADFPTSRVWQERVVPAGTPSVVFSGLAPGNYALAVFHDENKNGEFDQGFLGIPLEGYGFSNNARVFLGPPKFDEARVVLGEAGASISIAVTY
jgi:uncharacterized protein (DUF2141 family)